MGLHSMSPLQHAPHTGLVSTTIYLHILYGYQPAEGKPQIFLSILCKEVSKFKMDPCLEYSFTYLNLVAFTY